LLLIYFATNFEREMGEESDSESFMGNIGGKPGNTGLMRARKCVRE
jgi:hypothetical protein